MRSPWEGSRDPRGGGDYLTPPQGAGGGRFGLLPPPWARFPVTQRKKNHARLCSSGQTTEIRISSPQSGFTKKPQNTTTLFSPENSTHISPDEDSPPTPNRSLFNFILFHAMLVQGSFPSSPHPPSLLLLFITPPPQSLISFSPTHSDAACL